MNTIINNLNVSGFSFIREKFEKAFTQQQKDIIFVVTIAMGCLTALYLVRHFCFKAIVLEQEAPEALPQGEDLPKDLFDKHLSDAVGCEASSNSHLVTEIAASPQPIPISESQAHVKEEAIHRFYLFTSALTCALGFHRTEAWESISSSRADLRINMGEVALEVVENPTSFSFRKEDDCFYCERLALEANQMIDYLASPYRNDRDAFEMTDKSKRLVEIAYQDAVIEAVRKGWIAPGNIQFAGVESLYRLTVLKISHLLSGKKWTTPKESSFRSRLMQETSVYPPLTTAENRILTQTEPDYDEAKRVGHQEQLPTIDKDFYFSLASFSKGGKVTFQENQSSLKIEWDRLKKEWIEGAKERLFDLSKGEDFANQFNLAQQQFDLFNDKNIKEKKLEKLEAIKDQLLEIACKHTSSDYIRLKKLKEKVEAKIKEVLAVRIF